MSFLYEERASSSLFVHSIWRTRSQSDGCHLTRADGGWDLILIKQETTTKIMLAGPTSKATSIPYIAGSEYLGIRFQIGTFLTRGPLRPLVDVVYPLPEAGKGAFWLGDASWQLPTYDNVEWVIGKLVRSDLLRSDPVVQNAVLHRKDVNVSLRSVQRHFVRTVGMTQKTIHLIEQAHLATSLLQQGLPLLTVVQEAGYADQSHMGRALKCFIGQTPSQIISASRL